MDRRTAILNSLRELAPELERRFGVTRLSIFGSAARGEARPASDVDILVSFSPSARVTLLTLGALVSRIEECLGTRVDLVEDHPRLRPAFRQAIERDLCRVA